MSLYLDMWDLIHAAPVDYKLQFLKDHPRAEGIDLEFQGRKFFDVDLLEALRNERDR